MMSSRSARKLVASMTACFFVAGSVLVNDNALAKRKHPCTGITCSGHGSCILLKGQPRCACESGYTPDSFGINCVPSTSTELQRTDNEGTCKDITCSGHGKCKKVGDQAICFCDEGYVHDESRRFCFPSFIGTHDATQVNKGSDLRKSLKGESCVRNDDCGSGLACVRDICVSAGSADIIRSGQIQDKKTREADTILEAGTGLLIGSLVTSILSFAFFYNARKNGWTWMNHVGMVTQSLAAAGGALSGILMPIGAMMNARPADHTIEVSEYYSDHPTFLSFAPIIGDGAAGIAVGLTY